MSRTIKRVNGGGDSRRPDGRRRQRRGSVRMARRRPINPRAVGRTVLRLSLNEADVEQAAQANHEATSDDRKAPAEPAPPTPPALFANPEVSS